MPTILKGIASDRIPCLLWVAISITLLIAIMPEPILSADEMKDLESLMSFATIAELHRLKVLLEPRAGTPEASLAKYSPHRPWAKQAIFMNLDCEEAFYGGAAAGGKSDALLMAALQYVHVPGYSALILRRDFARLSLAGAIMDRAREWLSNQPDVHWSGQDKTFTFPSGARLQFGYIDNPQDRFRYASAEYQFIGWDELTEFRLSPDEADESNPYLFMFSRLRKTTDMAVPLRVRSASNPGNIGHAWVKKRFVPQDFRGITDESPAVFTVHGQTSGGQVYQTTFVPARIKDNPAIDENDYRRKLAHLPPVTRERLMAGDWSVAESLQIPEEWLKYYEMTGQHIHPENGAMIEEQACRRFATIDTAGTSRDKAEESRGKPPSWSVVGIWDHDRKGGRLFQRAMWRDRVGWNELKLRVPEFLKLWNCRRANIENAHVGQPLADELRAAGIQVNLVGPTLPGMADGYRGAKLERAIASGFLTMLEGGRVFLPREAPWIGEYKAEVLGWTGAPDETCDQIDVSSYAAWEVKSNSATWGGTV